MRLNLIKSNTILLISLLVVGCSRQGNTNPDVEGVESQGSLSLVANGEDFVREGFVTKDGWQINFERVDITVGEVTAYQVEGAFNPEAKSQIKSETAIRLVQEAQTINLAQGEEDADPIVITQSKAPKGFYNALSWKMLPITDQSIAGSHTILLEGTATKAKRKINFVLGFNQPTKYVCGEFVGDSRKGLVQPNDIAEVEMTFHFDHIFGDREADADDEINQNAVGFQPLADLATSDTLELGWQDLEQNLSPEEYQKLTNGIAGLGHVGEGHCSVTHP
ncbi:MAG: DUF4382 domain-containing protein [Xenococcaceae cyanobacterium MO_207.B15]|nr:DUF4382 domain-containing protein [Xenococcaceae cyanobacterium MO_207.B15]